MTRCAFCGAPAGGINHRVERADGARILRIENVLAWSDVYSRLACVDEERCNARIRERRGKVRPEPRDWFTDRMWALIPWGIMATIIGCGVLLTVHR